MKKYDYAAIEPLLNHRDQVGHLVRCAFECPLTGIHAAAGADGVGQRGPWARLLEALGLRDRPDPHQELEAATVEAFRKVSHRFHWDPLCACWVGRVASDYPGLEAPFMQRLRLGMPFNLTERSLLERMIVEVTRSSGQVTRREQRFLAALLDLTGVQSPADLPRAAPLTPLELEQASPGATRQSLLLIAWTAALCGGLGTPERNALERFRAGLRVSERATAELALLARTQLFAEQLQELALLHRGEELHAKVAAAGRELELSPDHADRVLALFRELRGRTRLTAAAHD